MNKNVRGARPVQRGGVAMFQPPPWRCGSGYAEGNPDGDQESALVAMTIRSQNARGTFADRTVENPPVQKFWRSVSTPPCRIRRREVRAGSLCQHDSLCCCCSDSTLSTHCRGLSPVIAHMLSPGAVGCPIGARCRGWAARCHRRPETPVPPCRASRQPGCCASA